MAGEEIFVALMVFGVFVLGGAFFWRMVRSGIRKDEFVHAYFTAKLKKHADKQNVDLTTEIKETQGYGFWENVAKNRKEAKQMRLNKSSVAQTDLLFEALEEDQKVNKK